MEELISQIKFTKFTISISNLTDLRSALLVDNTTSVGDACKCAAYKSIGPYCERWADASFEWCVLKESNHSKYCPGATQIDTDVYATRDKIVCNKSKRKYVYFILYIILILS